MNTKFNIVDERILDIDDLEKNIANDILRHLNTKFNECEGAAPANTTGMGNPSMPTDTTPGSGDLPTAKVKKRKKFKEIIEGILDMDDIESSVESNEMMSNIVVGILSNVVQNKKAVTDNDIMQLKNIIEVANENDVNPQSIAKRLRQKDNTAVIYFEKHPEYNDAIVEIRAFVRNPRPFQCIIAKAPGTNKWSVRRVGPCNHFTQISRNILKQIMFLEPEAWNEILGREYNKIYLR